jgi:putative flippase GtrA
MKKYPYYLYLVSVGIGVLTITFVMAIAGMLITELHAPDIITLPFTLGGIAAASVWSFLLPRKIFDKIHNKPSDTPV